MSCLTNKNPLCFLLYLSVFILLQTFTTREHKCMTLKHFQNTVGYPAIFLQLPVNSLDVNIVAQSNSAI